MSKNKNLKKRVRALEDQIRHMTDQIESLNARAWPGWLYLYSIPSIRFEQWCTSGDGVVPLTTGDGVVPLTTGDGVAPLTTTITWTGDGTGG